MFCSVLDRCESLIQQWRGESLLSVMFGKPFEESLIEFDLDDNIWTQPALFAPQAGLLAQWDSAGVRPQAVLGHSVGEIAAAYAAGHFSLEEVALAAERGALMGGLPTKGKQAGGMLAVFADRETVIALLPEGLSIAAENGSHLVVSGALTVLTKLKSLFEERSIRVEILQTSHAFHSELMEPILDPLEQVIPASLDKRSNKAAECQLVSNISGQILDSDEVLDGVYWRRHARQAVRFADGVKSLAAQGDVDVLIEVVPQRIGTDGSDKLAARSVSADRIQFSST